MVRGDNMFKKTSMNQKEMEEFLKEKMKEAIEAKDEDNGGNFKRVYIGSYMSLDPCGKYHNILSPNGIRQDCERFWESLEKVAGKFNGCISCGEGDPTDTFFEFDYMQRIEDGKGESGIKSDHLCSICGIELDALHMSDIEKDKCQDCVAKILDSFDIEDESIETRWMSDNMIENFLVKRKDIKKSMGKSSIPILKSWKCNYSKFGNSADPRGRL